ncbi:unnamed protein product [Sphagnum compactum]
MLPLSMTKMSPNHFSTNVAIEHPPHQWMVRVTDCVMLECRVELAFVVGASVIPHPDKVEKGGEDAYFISDYGGGVLGVADGVSGWAAEDVDPALYSRELMAHASNAAASEEMESNAQLLLHKAHSATCSIGAATAIVAILDRSGTLHVANVGDCGLRILRSGKVVFATSPQQHYFDCPYQFSSSEGGQSASDAAVFKAELLKGDTIVLGSDGLFDNVYDRDIESTLSVFGGSDQESAERTMALAILANKHSRDETYESPYSREAIQQGLDLPWWKKILGKKLTGGKVDDIAVLVGHVVDAEILPKPTPSLVSADLVDSSPDSAAATDVEAPPSKDESPADLPDQFPEGLAESWA